jgi:hypothetical protein
MPFHLRRLPSSGNKLRRLHISAKLRLAKHPVFILGDRHRELLDARATARREGAVVMIHCEHPRNARASTQPSHDPREPAESEY